MTDTKTQGDVTVDACIAEYLAPEHLTGVTCEMCSLRQTLAQYHAEAERLSAPPGAVPNGSTPTHRTSSGSFAALEDLPTSDGPQGVMTPSRKKRARDARRVETRLKEILDSGVVTGFGDSTLPPGPSSSVPIPVKWQTARTDSIREAIVTRPPQSLRLHFIRSEYTPYGTLLKKTARVAFPMILDLTRFVARGIWEERAGVLGAIAAQGAAPPRRALYRLESAILHYGYTHSSGHFICIRRKPKPPPTLLTPSPPSDRVGDDDQAEDEGSYSGYRPSSARKSCPDGCHCQSCVYFGQVRSAEGDQSVPGKGWLRISDADMDEVGEEALIEARGAVFMLFYERVGEYEGERAPVVPSAPASAPQQQDGDTPVPTTEKEAQE
jgi:ubiquitin carboxyl-terminal hydrolase 1